MLPEIAPHRIPTTSRTAPFPAALRERAERVLSVRDRVRRERGSNLASFRFDLLKGEEYRQEADRQKLLVKKAEVTQSRLLFIVEAIRELRDDENFANLLRAESLNSRPAFLEQRIADGMVI